MRLCARVNQMSCIRLLTRCVSVWLSSPRLYVILPGVLCARVTVCIMVRVCGCRTDGVCVPTAAAQNTSKLTSFEAFYVSCVWAHTHSHTHTDLAHWHRRSDWLSGYIGGSEGDEKEMETGGRQREEERCRGRKRREGWHMTYSDGHWGLREVRIAVKESEKQWATSSSDEDRERQMNGRNRKE